MIINPTKDNRNSWYSKIVNQKRNYEILNMLKDNKIRRLSHRIISKKKKINKKTKKISIFKSIYNNIFIYL